MRLYAWLLAPVLLASPTVLGANLTSLSVSPASVVGGVSGATGTVTLDAAAPAGGAVVTLTSSLPTRATRAGKG